MRGVDVPFSTPAHSATTFKANVGIGSPPTFYTLIVDTGSANTWVSARGSQHPYKPTETSKESKRSVSTRYGTGSFRGKLWYDCVKIGSLFIENQGIGVAEDAFGFEDGVDGILGLGLAELTKEFLIRESDDDELEVIPTIIDNLFEQGKIQQRMFSISFDRMSATLRNKDYKGEFHGVLTLGGTDPSRYTGEMIYVPISQDKPSSKHWSFEQTITYGSQKKGGIEILKNGIGVIDSGSSVVHLTPGAFDAYRHATHADFDCISKLLSLPPNEKINLKSLFFEIGGRSFEIPPEEQVWPQELNDVAGGPAEDSYLSYIELRSDNGVGISLINGFTWLQHFYIVLDVDNKRIGFARATLPSTRLEPTRSGEDQSMDRMTSIRQTIKRRISSLFSLLPCIPCLRISELSSHPGRN
ncbi:hypothetical protein ACEPAI_4539 [Sanghuangporus weigelae]